MIRGVNHRSGSDRNMNDFLMENWSLVVKLNMRRLIHFPNVMTVAVIPARAECKNRNR